MTETSTPAAPAPVALLKATNLKLHKMVVDRLSQLRDRPRRPGFHPSEIHGMCPVLQFFKEEAVAGLGDDQPAKHYEFLAKCLEYNTRKFPGTLRMEFEIGDAIHQMVQYQLGVTGLLWGYWMCATPHCSARTAAGFMPRITVPGVKGEPVFDAAPCERCNGMNRREKRPWTYLEPKIESLDWGLTGQCDGDLRITRGGITRKYVLEIKSIHSAGFSGQTKEPLPKPEHVTQASVYAHFMGDVEGIYFIYVNKDAVSKWKEFLVPADPIAIATAKHKMHATLLAMRDRKPPLHARTCSDFREVEARQCPAVEKCFGCKPPASLWDEGSNEDVFHGA